jgi:hypothetical protein
VGFVKSMSVVIKNILTLFASCLLPCTYSLVPKSEKLNYLMIMLSRQFHIFLNALMFYTRIPVPKWMKHDEDMLNQATVYFPVIGWIVGAISSLVFTFFR